MILINNKIMTPLFEFVALVVLMLLIPSLISYDVVSLQNNLSELSVTELTHEFFILISSLIFFNASFKNKESKGLYILISSLFILMFIREMDYFLDFVYHGFWKTPVILVLLITIFFAYKNKTTIFKPLLNFTKSKIFNYMLVGLLITILFSRLFGTGSLWREIMGNDYQHLYKTIIQEALELFGYGLIFIGSILFHFSKKNQSK